MPDFFKAEAVSPPPRPLSYSQNCLHDDVPEADTQDHKKLNGVVLVDMDNTLNDWDSQFRWVMQQYFPEVPIVPPSERRHYCM